MPNDTTFEVTLVGGDKVEIGDKESTDFKPHIKLNRWDGECFIAIKPANLVEEEVEVEVEGDKVKCKYKVKYEDDTEEEFEVEFYPLEPTTVIAKDKDGNDVPFTQNELGGFEFEVILKKKPASNKIVLDIETQELKFYYQPELTQQEIAEGCIRPDNVVGSYAVYHATRTPFHESKADADKYKVGKAFHIYRPKITDADGKWVWGDLSLDEQAGTLTTTIPQDFLDTAVYPVSTGTTNFGFEGVGGAAEQAVKDYIRGSWFLCPSLGTAISISYYGKLQALLGGNAYGKTAIYKESDNSLIGVSDEIYDDIAPDQWIQLNFSDPKPSLDNIDYYLVFWTDGPWGTMYYDSEGDKGGYQSLTYNSFPDPSWNPILEGRKYFIYCTYEEAAPPTGQPYISRVQGVQGMRSWGGI